MTPNTPLEAFLHWEKETPNLPFLRQPFNGRWKTWTYKQAGKEIRCVANGLRKLHLTPGSHIALLSKNCAHWILGDLAIMMNGSVSVPLYPTLSENSIRQILEHSESRAIIIGKLDNFHEQRNGIPEDVIKIGVQAYGVSVEQSWEQLKKEDPIEDVHPWKSEDLLTIIYTSGTTGDPKGVMHIANAFDATVKAAIHDLKLKTHTKLFSYLPLSHIAERMGIEMQGLYSGSHISFPESIDTFPKNLENTQPDIFFAVPRLWTKFQEKILQQLPQKKLDRLLSIPVINNLIKKRIVRKLGLSNASVIISGAAPIAVELLDWFKKIGVEILQAYGMTEDCVYSHFNHPDANKPGTVGLPLTGLKVRISSEGEILLKSDGNMKGYFKQPELTAQAFDEDGYLKTGDLGEYDKDGFLIITGRAKDQFKTDKGKYVSPSSIETKWMINMDIEHVCVVGTGMPQPLALVTLTPDARKKAKANTTMNLLVTLTAVNNLVEKYEAVEKVVVLKNDWTIENGLLTPKLSVKRYAVEKQYMNRYTHWYDQEATVIWE